MNQRTRQLTVSSLTRVEGEGSLLVTVRDDRVERAALQIYEPPRFFEALLRGRAHTEPPDITARVCGICPVAYQTSACQAIENACGIHVEGPLADLRRLLYCGEWISSHALHIFLLHLPDFLGYPDAISLAKDHREFVERGLALKKAGNAIMDLLGGRAIHPINPRLGGFYRTPTPGELTTLTEPLRRALDDAIATVRLVSSFEFPDVELDCDLLALHRDDCYAIEAGALRSAGGLACDVADFDAHVTEHQVVHSTALHARLNGHRYLTGPLARYTLNSGQLSPTARQTAADAGLTSQCRNPFRSIVVRAVEIVYALDEALRLIAAYQPPPQPCLDVPPRAGIGHGASEAPPGVAVPPLSARRRRVDPGRHDCPAHRAEPGRHRRRPAPAGVAQPAPR